MTEKRVSVQGGGGKRFTIRVESYNLTNTASFQPPDGNFGATTFGSISTTGNALPRQMQFGVKYVF